METHMGACHAWQAVLVFLTHSEVEMRTGQLRGHELYERIAICSGYMESLVRINIPAEHTSEIVQQLKKLIARSAIELFTEALRMGMRAFKSKFPFAA